MTELDEAIRSAFAEVRVSDGLRSSTMAAVRAARASGGMRSPSFCDDEGETPKGAFGEMEEARAEDPCVAAPVASRADDGRGFDNVRPEMLASSGVDARETRPLASVAKDADRRRRGPHAEAALPDAAVPAAKRAPSKKRPWYRGVAAKAVAAMLCVALAGAGGTSLYATETAFASITAQSSITLGINRFDRVVSVDATRNESGVDIESLHLEGMTYDEAVAELVGSGYLGEGDVDAQVDSDDRTQQGNLVEATRACLSEAGCSGSCNGKRYGRGVGQGQGLGQGQGGGGAQGAGQGSGGGQGDRARNGDAQPTPSAGDGGPGSAPGGSGDATGAGTCDGTGQSSKGGNGLGQGRGGGRA